MILAPSVNFTEGQNKNKKQKKAIIVQALAYKECDFVAYYIFLSKDLWVQAAHDTVNRFFSDNYKNLYTSYTA